jgi:hypothetical protein
MINYLLIVLLLIPSLAIAETKCNYIDYPDRDVVDCSGDEAASKAADQKVAPPQPLQSTAQNLTNQTDVENQVPYDASQKPADPEATVTPPASQPAQPASNQNTIMHRQGRQQFQQSLEDAKASRKQLIMEKQQLQTAPPATVTPAPSGTVPN